MTEEPFLILPKAIESFNLNLTDPDQQDDDPNGIFFGKIKNVKFQILIFFGNLIREMEKKFESGQIQQKWKNFLHHFTNVNNNR